MAVGVEGHRVPAMDELVSDHRNGYAPRYLDAGVAVPEVVRAVVGDPRVLAGPCHRRADGRGVSPWNTLRCGCDRPVASCSRSRTSTPAAPPGVAVQRLAGDVRRRRRLAQAREVFRFHRLGQIDVAADRGSISRSVRVRLEDILRVEMSPGGCSRGVDGGSSPLLHGVALVQVGPTRLTSPPTLGASLAGAERSSVIPGSHPVHGEGARRALAWWSQLGPHRRDRRG